MDRWLFRVSPWSGASWGRNRLAVWGMSSRQWTDRAQKQLCGNHRSLHWARLSSSLIAALVQFWFYRIGLCFLFVALWPAFILTATLVLPLIEGLLPVYIPQRMRALPRLRGLLWSVQLLTASADRYAGGLSCFGALLEAEASQTEDLYGPGQKCLWELAFLLGLLLNSFSGVSHGKSGVVWRLYTPTIKSRWTTAVARRLAALTWNREPCLHINSLITYNCFLKGFRWYLMVCLFFWFLIITNGNPDVVKLMISKI